MPAAAVVPAFASFTPTGTATTRNLRWERIGASDGALYTIASTSGTAPGSINVRFSFLQPQFAPYATNLLTAFTLNATTTASPATLGGGLLTQSVTSGSFSFRTIAPLTIHSRVFPVGTVLLAGSFGNGAIAGTSGSSMGAFTLGSTGGRALTFTSDILDFAGVTTRQADFDLSAIASVLARASPAASLRTFRARAAGVFRADPLPVSAIPEPGSWAMLIAGFGLVGAAGRRRRAALPA